LVVGLCTYALSVQWLESRGLAVLAACSLMVLLGTPLVYYRILYRAQARLQLLEHEISELRARETLLVDKAHHDDLTGLANRGLLADRFRGATERAKRSRTSFALLMIDLNDFKAINDTYGHAVGDKVLVTIARRLLGAVRASDTVARIGGDEFVLLIEAIEDSTELAQIGQKLLDTLAEPIHLSDGVVLHTGASVGLSLYPADGVDLNDLLYVADQAMYECKTTGMMSLV
jgi:diguanylate cyclase (GGDEF)-like protein